MKYAILLHPKVINKDLPSIDGSIRPFLLKIINKKLKEDPLHYGEHLRKDLKGGMKLRAGDYRILFEVNKNSVKIYRIDHRSVVYKKRPVKRDW